MAIVNQPATKHKFDGIGEAGAAIILAGLAANAGTVWLTVGFIGKTVWFLVKLMCMGLASIGLVVLNVGAEKIETIMAENKFDGSWDSAKKLIDEIHRQGRELTDEEKKRIDDPVKDAFRRFGRFGRLRQR